jgi:hypothetical protein
VEWGAKQILGLVSLIAVSAFAFWAGPIVAGALGAGALGAAGSAIAGGLATGLLGLGGALLVNALIMPKPGATNAPDSTQDQIYSVLAQGNAAKLGQPLPVWYGRLKAFPEFAATPWAEFVGNDQWLNVLLSVSMGSMSYEALYVDDTVLWDPVNGISSTFTGAQVAFYEPGETVTLFPVNVDASSEVNGQQLPDGAGSTNFPGGATPGPPLGPFVANPPATLAQSIAIDFVFPAGCFSINPDDQQLIARVAFIRLIAEYAPVNDAGAITGPFIPLFDVVRAYASKSPIRDSIKVDVPFGRYAGVILLHDDVRRVFRDLAQPIEQPGDQHHAERDRPGRQLRRQRRPVLAADERQQLVMKADQDAGDRQEPRGQLGAKAGQLRLQLLPERGLGLERGREHRLLFEDRSNDQNVKQQQRDNEQQNKPVHDYLLCGFLEEMGDPGAERSRRRVGD